MKTFKQYNESVENLSAGKTSLRDKMTPKPKDAIKSLLYKYFESKRVNSPTKTLLNIPFINIDNVYFLNDENKYYEEVNDYLYELTRKYRGQEIDYGNKVYTCYPELQIIKFWNKGAVEGLYFDGKYIESIINYISSNKIDESLRDKMTPKNTEEVNDAVIKRMNKYPELGQFNPFDWGFTFNDKTLLSHNIFVFDSPDGRMWSIVLWSRVFPYPISIRETQKDSNSEYRTNNYSGVENFLRNEGYKEVVPNKDKSKGYK